MHTYLVELYFPPYPNDKKRIRAKLWSFRSYNDARDQLTPDMIKYAFVDALNINIARDSARELFVAPDAIIEKGW